jgi:prevent-host-death family protein
MIEMSTAEARENFAEIMNNAIYKHERTILTRRGKGVVAVVPLQDLKILEALEDKADIVAAEAAMREIKKHGTISLAKLKEELGL